jgi:exonuclease III
MRDYLLSHADLSKDDQIIVLGDFNDYDPEIVDAAGPLDRPISDVVGILRGAKSVPMSHSPSSTHRPRKHPSRKLEGILYNVAHGIPEKRDRYSCWYDRNSNCKDDGDREHTLIDHVLVTPYLRDRINSTYIDHAYDEFCGKYNSDHWPIYVSFDLSW